jgi:hypothetical protein
VGTLLEGHKHVTLLNDMSTVRNYLLLLSFAVIVLALLLESGRAGRARPACFSWASRSVPFALCSNQPTACVNGCNSAGQHCSAAYWGGQEGRG